MVVSISINWSDLVAPASCFLFHGMFFCFLLVGCYFGRHVSGLLTVSSVSIFICMCIYLSIFANFVNIRPDIFCARYIIRCKLHIFK